MEKRQQEGTAFRTVGAFALGATLGSVIALLYAPASGQVTRKRIGMKVRTMQRTAGRQLEQAKRTLARRAEGLRDAATEKLTDAREWVVERVANGNGRQTRHRTAHHA